MESSAHWLYPYHNTQLMRARHLQYLLMKYSSYQRPFSLLLSFYLSSTLFFTLAASAQNPSPTNKNLKRPQGMGKTAFQVAAPWNERYDVGSDIAIVYGINDDGGNFEERVRGWRNKGYEVHFMTGIAWGQYKDYFLGTYDGKQHFDEGQKKRNGDTIWHGKNVPYIVPTAGYLEYLKTHAKKAIDAGVTAIHLEEPEFWTAAGYSESFKKEWQQFYGTPWVAQHESPDATYQSSKLKYHLYFNALKEMFSYIKTYSRQKGREVQCFVPTHSLINYSSWGIVSPEASLAGLKDMDGYIAQVWTGTSREPVFYNGEKKERVFENAFLEYGSMVSMTAPTGRKVFFLTDPIEDWPRTWDDYKKNYQATYTAQLLYPMVTDYEVMPWPNRIYLGKFKMENSDTRQPIPPAYASQMQVMVNALNDMPGAAVPINGSKGIGVLVSNSMMFQRFPTHEGYEDPQLSNFYGMALPLLKKGIPVETVHMENLNNINSLKYIKVLVMSYSNYKPLSPSYHEALNQWVRNGGILLYYGTDTDAFQKVKEWWNRGNKSYPTASAHLFELLGISGKDASDFIKVGKGAVLIEKKDPKELVLTAGGEKDFLSQITLAYEKYAIAGKLQFKNNFSLKRGQYIVSAVLDENDSKEPLVIKGPVVDLFDPALPVLARKEILPGEQSFLYDLATIDKRKPVVLAAAARVLDQRYEKNIFRFTVRAPSETVNVMRIYLPSSPDVVKIEKNGLAIPATQQAWDSTSKTLYIQFANYSEGVNLEIQLSGKSR